VLAARGQGGKYCGFAVEIGEAPAYGDFAAFQKAVLAQSRADVSALADGVAEFKAVSGRSVKLRFAATVAETEVWRDGQRHDLQEHARFLYRNAGIGDGIIHQDWLGGRLSVRAGGAAFTGDVDERGMAKFQNR
jgi:hypothetical protein